MIIDTEKPVEELYIPEEYREKLNRPTQNPGLIHVDLTIETKNHLGIISTEAINGWLEEIPTLRTIVVLLKSHLSLHSLNENYNKGLNTYSLIIMLVALIYHEELMHENRISFVLQRVLGFYGWEFDEKKTRIDIRNTKNIYQKKKFKSKSADL